VIDLTTEVSTPAVIAALDSTLRVQFGDGITGVTTGGYWEDPTGAALDLLLKTRRARPDGTMESDDDVIARGRSEGYSLWHDTVIVHFTGDSLLPADHTQAKALVDAHAADIQAGKLTPPPTAADALQAAIAALPDNTAPAGEQIAALRALVLQLAAKPG